MGVLYIIFNPGGCLESFFSRAVSRKEGMSVLTNRTTDSGIRSVCHMVVFPRAPTHQSSHRELKNESLKCVEICDKFLSKQAWPENQINRKCGLSDARAFTTPRAPSVP